LQGDKIAATDPIPEEEVKSFFSTYRATHFSSYSWEHGLSRILWLENTNWVWSGAVGRCGTPLKSRVAIRSILGIRGIERDDLGSLR
jgi:hypothetical protein